jgi:succinate dehydrogenase / fumarate reductase cytochrome b subunit
MLYATILTLKNRAARPVKYAVTTQSDVSWSSRNMFITGFAILTFLVIHLVNYFYKIKFTDLIESGKMTEFELVQGIFQPEYWYYSVLYIISFVFLALHLNHSFQSAWHTLGLSNSKWLPRLKVIGTLYTLVVAVGFTIIPIYFFLKAVL